MTLKAGTRRILIYGDSNTWGSGAFGGRYDTKEQWSYHLQQLLGEGYEVVQEGVCGRIAGAHIQDDASAYKNGRTYFEVAEHAACPFDILIIALGTNDVKDKYGLSSTQIMEDLMWYKHETEAYADRDDDMPALGAVLYVGIANFKQTDHFQADSAKAAEVNAGLQAKGLPVVIPDMLDHSDDGLHYSKEDHKKVAKLVYEKMKELGL